jgi:5-carboxymethyl-2-hydroxymuconate isomerase
MPHLTIQYSHNISRERAEQLCAALLQTLLETRLYPQGGIRVRAFPSETYVVADGHPRNAFVDMVFRIGAGRSVVDKKTTGESLMQAAETVFASELANPHFALSLEIVEIDPLLSWKTNSIHARLKGSS